MKLARRKKDGVLFKPICPSDDDTDTWARIWRGVFKTGGYYFEELKEEPRRWWHIRKVYRRTGVIWEPQDHEFDVIDDSNCVIKKRKG